MSVTWDADLLGRVRERAAAGRSMRQAAADLHVPLTSLSGNASDHKIKFNGSRFIPPSDRPMAGARQELAHQIRLALSEAALAPLYQGWPGLILQPVVRFAGEPAQRLSDGSREP
jgi:hypothetical protein